MHNYNEYISGRHVTLVYIDEYLDVELEASIIDKCKEYDITYSRAKNKIDIDKEFINDNSVFKHFIVRLTTPFDGGYIKNILSPLVKSKGITGTIVFSYSDENNSLSYVKQIDQIKKYFGESINIIRPDRFYNNKFTASDFKIVDNIICDTIRVKFIPKKKSGNIEVPTHVTDYFYQCSRIYEKYNMYHRSPSDGYFAYRSSANDFYITATKTRKDSHFSSSRISLVHGYDQSNNEILYSGEFLPSSDSVEAAILLYNNPDIQTLMHTHDSVRFTRNGNILAPRVPKLPYGESELGHELSDVYKSSGSELIIMEEHGEVFIGRHLKSASEVAQFRVEQDVY